MPLGCAGFDVAAAAAVDAGRAPPPIAAGAGRVLRGLLLLPVFAALFGFFFFEKSSALINRYRAARLRSTPYDVPRPRPKFSSIGQQPVSITEVRRALHHGIAEH